MKEKIHGHYIVVEGLEGSGKTTICNIIVNILKDIGINEVIITHEPGGTYLAEKLRALLLDTQSNSDEEIYDKTETLMFYAARIQLIEKIVKPALKAGNWVVGDRHDSSTHAYQGGGRGVNKEILETLRNIILSNFRPTITLYLDITPEVSFERVRARVCKKLDRIEQESLAFFNRTRTRYLELVEKDTTMYKINAMQPLQLVSCDIRKIIIDRFHKK